MKKISKHHLVIGSVFFIIGISSLSLAYSRYNSSLYTSKPTSDVAQEVTDKTKKLELNKEQLSEYNGDNPDKPIYIAMDGLIYDVTQGRKYYQTDGAYHYIAGTDATSELHIAGGDIIKRKYLVVGKLIQ